MEAFSEYVSFVHKIPRLIQHLALEKFWAKDTYSEKVSFVHKIPRLIQHLALEKFWAIPGGGVLKELLLQTRSRNFWTKRELSSVSTCEVRHRGKKYSDL
jgi:hypothetical protein